MRATVTEKTMLSGVGRSVVGIAKLVLEYMETQDTTYPGQYTLAINDQQITITRTYQRELS